MVRRSVKRSNRHRGILTLCQGASYTRRRVRSIVAMNPAGRVTVPAEVRRNLGLGQEAFFEIQVQRGAIVLKPVAVVPLEQAKGYSTSRRRAS